MAAAISNAVRRGSCLCRKVTYTLSGPPARMIQCNCLNCQKVSGSAFLTNILYKGDQYKIDSGAEHIKIFRDEAEVESGNALERAFCGNCGSSLSIRNVTNPQMAGNVVVCAGSLDGNHETFVPQSELFPHRRHAWVPAVKRPEKKEKAKM